MSGFKESPETFLLKASWPDRLKFPTYGNLFRATVNVSDAGR